MSTTTKEQILAAVDEMIGGVIDLARNPLEVEASLLELALALRELRNNLEVIL